MESSAGVHERMHLIGNRKDGHIVVAFDVPCSRDSSSVQSEPFSAYTCKMPVKVKTIALHR